MKQKLFNLLSSKKVERAYMVGVLVFMGLFMSFKHAYAYTPTLITHAKNFGSDATTWILILLPIASGAMIGYHAIMKALSDGEQSTIIEHNRKMKGVLKALAWGESGTALVSIIIHYFS